MDTRYPFDLSPDPIAFGVEFNEDNTVFAVGSENGFRVFDTASGKLLYQREMEGSVLFASVLCKSTYVALIGGGPAPVYSPNKLVLWEDRLESDTFKIEYNFIPIRACLTRSNYCVIFEHGVILYKLYAQAHGNDRNTRVGVYETTLNPFGLCFLGEKKMIIPGRSRGQVQVVDIATQKTLILPAHEANLRMLAVNRDETILATAGGRGTLIKLWSTTAEASILKFRRGLDQASIFSMAFSPSGNHLAVTSDKSTVHIFDMPWAEQKSAERPLSTMSTRSDRTVSKPVAVPHKRGASITSGTSPRSRANEEWMPPLTHDKYGVSPSSMGRSKSGTSPNDRASLSPSDISPYSQSGGIVGWHDIPRNQQKGGTRRSFVTSGGSSEQSTESELSTKRSSQKYGNLGNMPLAPKFLSDIYSSMSCKFEMGHEPTRQVSRAKAKERVGVDDETASISTIRTTATAVREKDNPWWSGGRAPKGKVAWVDDDSLVIIGAGRDARWEKFVLGFDQNGQQGIERRGWKKYMEDEGVDG